MKHKQLRNKVQALRNLRTEMAKTRQSWKAKDNLTFMWGVIIELDENNKLPVIPYPKGDVTIDDLKGESA